MTSAADIEAWQRDVSEACAPSNNLNNTAIGNSTTDHETDQDECAELLDQYMNNTMDDETNDHNSKNSSSRKISRASTSLNRVNNDNDNVNNNNNNNNIDDIIDPELNHLLEEFQDHQSDRHIEESPVKLLTPSHSVKEEKHKPVEEDDLPSYKSRKSSLYRYRKSLSRAASTVRYAISANEVLTEGISELEAQEIAKATLPRGMSAATLAQDNSATNEEQLKFFQTDKWFSSSTETGLYSLNKPTGMTRTAGMSILQNESIHNPFFKEDRITALPLTGVSQLELSLSNASVPPQLTINWGMMNREKYQDIGSPDTANEFTKLKTESLKQEPKTAMNRSTCFYIMVFLQSMLLIVSLSVLVPLCLHYYKGTWNSTVNYLSNLSPSERSQSMNGLILQFGGGSNNTQSRGRTNSQLKIQETLFQFNAYENINPYYKANSKIRHLMTNPNLKNVFYGVDYAPKNAILPSCGIDKNDVILDIAALSKVTTRVRLYGMHCRQLQLVLDSIRDLGVNMTVSLGLWINNNELNNQYQLRALSEVLVAYPAKLIDSVMVGDEVLLRGDKTAMELNRIFDNVTQVLTMTNKTSIKMGTSESLTSLQKLPKLNITGLNVHPFLQGLDIDNATDYVMSYINSNREVMISELGWPTNGGKFQKSQLSTANLQKIIDNLLCPMNKMLLSYYWFELFDEPWKQVFDDENRHWESHWGLFDRDRNIKIKLPTCL